MVALSPALWWVWVPPAPGTIHPLPPACSVAPYPLPIPPCAMSLSEAPPAPLALTLRGEGSQGVRKGDAQRQEHRDRHLWGEGQREGTRRWIPGGAEPGRSRSGAQRGWAEREEPGAAAGKAPLGGRWAQLPALPGTAPGRECPSGAAPFRLPVAPQRRPCLPLRALLPLVLRAGSCRVYSEPRPRGAAPR